MMTIAYLAPALTALESTFIYDELFALEARGMRVVPVSVHRPHTLLAGHDDLLARTHYLYDGGPVRTLARSLPGLINPNRKRARSLRWLLGDIRRTGILHRQSWKLAYQYLAAVRLAEILIGNDCRHLHIHFAHVPTQIGMYAAAIAGIPYTIMAHANDIFERGFLLKSKAERAAKMFTISEHNRAYLERAGVPADKLAVLRCGVSFTPRPRQPSCEARDIYRIGTLARLVEKKGMDVLIRAVDELRNRPYRILLSIAGDGPLRADLEKLVADLDLRHAVRFEGSMPHDRVRDWMHGLDAFVLACKADANGDMDGIPVVLMEAMSQSVPVVSTRLSGIPELILDEETGLLAAPGDHADLAARIDRLLAEPDLRSRLATRARGHVLGEFGQDTNIDRLLGHIVPATL